jgi:prepilin-type N-terminal cleavage/methylation domain-containing protein
MLTHPVSAQRRHGVSIIELMISLTIFGLVMAGVMSAITEQTRFQTGAARVVGSQRSLRHISDLLPSELRALGTGAGDIYSMNASSIDLRVTTGSSVVCAVAAGGMSVTIPPVQLATAVPLTSWRDVPLAGDSVFIFDEGASTARNDDVWRTYRLTAAPAAGTCATATGFTRSAAEAAAGMTLTVATAIPATTVAGAPIRFFRRARYALATGADGRWYLGYTECAAACGPLDMVAGPVSAPSSRGVGFTFRDSLGMVTAAPAEVAFVELELHTDGAPVGERSRMRSGALADSLRVSVAVRNPR